MFKNPFYQFGIGDRYLLKFAEGGSLFAEGGLLEGKSHAEGGIKTRVGRTPVELEGGEFVIRKSTVDHFGEDFFHKINNMDMNSISDFASRTKRKFKQEAEIQRYDIGGPILGPAIGFGKDLVGAFDDLGKNLLDFTGQKTPSKQKHRGEGAHLSSDDPARLIKEKEDLPTLKFFDVSLSPSEHLENVVGKTNIDLKLGFPYDNSADINILGKSVSFGEGGRIFRKGGPLDHKTGSLNEDPGSLLDASFGLEKASLTTGNISKTGLSEEDVAEKLNLPSGDITVSYTHLTLPTIYSV